MFLLYNMPRFSETCHYDFANLSGWDCKNVLLSLFIFKDDKRWNLTEAFFLDKWTLVLHCLLLASPLIVIFLRFFLSFVVDINETFSIYLVTRYYVNYLCTCDCFISATEWKLFPLFPNLIQWLWNLYFDLCKLQIDADKAIW